MNQLLFALALLTPCAAFAADAAPAPAAKAAAAPKDPFKTDDERVVYALGRALGRNVAPFALSAAEVKILNDGLRDEVLKKASPVDLQAYGQKINEVLRARMGAAAAKEAAKGKAYADAFAKEEGVKPIPGGGLIKHLVEGKGDSPTAEDTVKVHYRGTLIDGTEFDSSYKRNEPIETGLSGGLVQCWLKGIPLLKTGGKAKLVCPSDVAYGDDGRPPVIKGGATLVFEVELVEVLKAGKTKK
ncbi:MAG: FKBP-type peptidyl-prolyl cis-trans isomerase [Elusimicrobiota bacterium]|nr:FKBP-type peptidyl-prolyl cis-trans isomerase [Elusimicrobiota bacterium]